MQTDKMPIYPVEPWTVTEQAFELRNNYRNETTFALSNGYIGTRGTFEEAYPFDIDTGLEGNFVNGFYESEKIRYGEANFGSPLLSQSLLNLPNLKETHVFLDGEIFDMRNGSVEEYSRTLHMRDGILERRLIWTSPQGKRARIRIRRLVSMVMKNIMAISYEVTPLNFEGEICFESILSADVENHTRKTNPIVDYGPFGRKLEKTALEADERSLYYEGVTQTSRLTVGCGSFHKAFTAEAGGGQEQYSAMRTETKVNSLDASLTLHLPARRNVSVRLEKMICYSSSLDMEAGELQAFVRNTLNEAEKLGFWRLEEKQKLMFRRFWETADIEIEGKGNEELSQGIRFNLFHIFQSAGRDGKTGMGAKGLSGEGYEGHYFWDTEMYVMPVFIYTEPETAKHLLEYRYGTLAQARERARVLGHPKGALFPWRTINGEEASTYYPLGTAQYHINADIEYALALYLQVTGDLQFFKEKGAELIIETARIWADVGSFAECRDGKYCICSVTGPDEYNVLVDNNFYTNLMAREHLRDAIKAVRYLEQNDKGTLLELADRLELDREEVAFWEKIVENMYFPYDERRQIYPMDDGFMMRRPWDESRIPEEKRAWLYENYHPLFIMRHRMSKQADAILGMYLHSNLFSEKELKRNYDFYQEMTLHHSSLSTCIFGIVACDIGARIRRNTGKGAQEEAEKYFAEAYEYFSQSARMDLDDYHNNFYAGIHAANMAGTWQAIVNGFAGMRCFEGKLSFQPYIPGGWSGYRFGLRFGESVIQVRITGDGAEFTLMSGGPVTVWVYDREVELTECGKTVNVMR